MMATGDPAPDPRMQRFQLGALATALVLAMSPWFSAAAVLGQLKERWALGPSAGAWLTIAVQVGFVLGAVASSVLRVADRVPPRRIMLYSAAGAAIANGAMVVVGSYSGALLVRLATGFALAGVYPPALKAMSSWYRAGRGFALGVMIAALTLGSAAPHALNAVGGFGWQPLMLIVSGLTFAGGLIAQYVCGDGPYLAKSAAVRLEHLGAIVRNRSFRLASLGYFGHMWELYALWAWVAVFYGDVFTGNQNQSRLASAAAFAVIAAGVPGSIFAGRLSDRSGRAVAASLALKGSGVAAMVTGFLVDAPAVIVVAAGLWWGFWVVADSAQFSAIVTEVVDGEVVGTALTIQLAAGFVLTVATIFLVPVVRDAAGWGFAFLLLAPGPVVGVLAMNALIKSDSETTHSFARGGS